MLNLFSFFKTKNLIKNTPPDNPEQQSLKEALEHLKGVVDLIDNRAEQESRLQRMLELQRLFIDSKVRVYAKICYSLLFYAKIFTFLFL